MEKIKKHKIDIFVIIVAFVIILSKIITRELNNLDEIWQFNMARNIANGLLPYKDFNLIVTPGLYMVCGLILKILGTELLYMRVLATALCTAIVYMFFKILEQLKVNTEINLLSTIGISYLFLNHFCIDYNFAILLIALICLFLELKNIEKNDFFEYRKKYDFTIGILAGISILMKQTVGICFAVMLIGYKIIEVRKKEDFKLWLKIALTRGIGTLVPIVLLLLYLFINGIFMDFVNYTILGVKEFSNSVSYKNLFFGNLKILAVVVPIIMIMSIIIGIWKKNNKLITFFAFSISMFIVVYPISDDIHFLIASAISMITGIYLIQIMLNRISLEKINIKVKIFFQAFIDSVLIVMGVMSIFISIYNISNSYYKAYKNLSNFKNVPVSYSLERVILSVDEYMRNSENECYIVDARAAIFMIPLNRYNKNYDMFNSGNLGKNGIENVINDLDKKENAKILIVNDNVGLNWQTPIDVINYIKNNYQKIDEIEYFDVYIRQIN